MRRLLACPFCRSLYGEDETDGTCPECGVELRAMDELPPSLEVIAEEAASGDWVAPEERVLPWWYVGRGRGMLLLLAVLGIAAFFAPWVQMSKPDLVALRGFDLARGRAGWLWGGAVAWFVMIPLVATRRTVVSMRGVRIVTALFAAMTLGEVVMMIAAPPSRPGPVPLAYHWGWGLYASLAISLLGVYFGARFGGSLQSLAIPWREPPPTAAPERSGDETLH